MSEPKGILGPWRITPEKINDLEFFEVFVFGSNLEGIHGKGAAKTAVKWGAKRGAGTGLQGRTYAIPTRMVVKRVGHHVVFKSLTLEEIQMWVTRFVEEAAAMPNKTFLVTQIGCGNAGFEPTQIAPMFEEAAKLDNVHLPLIFWESMGGQYPPR